MAETDPPTTVEIQENLDILQGKSRYIMASAWSVSRFFYAGMYVGGQRDSLSPNFPFSPSGKRLLQVPSPRINHIFLLSLLLFPPRVSQLLTRFR